MCALMLVARERIWIEERATYVQVLPDGAVVGLAVPHPWYCGVNATRLALALVATTCGAMHCVNASLAAAPGRTALAVLNGQLTGMLEYSCVCTLTAGVTATFS